MDEMKESVTVTPWELQDSVQRSNQGSNKCHPVYVIPIHPKPIKDGRGTGQGSNQSKPGKFRLCPWKHILILLFMIFKEAD